MRRAVLAVALMILVACGGRGTAGSAGGGPPTAADGPPEAAAEGYDGKWQLQSGRDASGRIPGADAVTLEISGRRFSGIAACNHYDAEGRIDGTRLRVRTIARTAMGCAPGPMITEERYLDALKSVTAIKRHRDTLRLTGESVVLKFVPVPPRKPAAFEDTRWQLHTLAYGRGPDGSVSSTMAPGVITFASDGTLTAATGCRDVTGRWRRDGDTVTVTNLPTDDVDCPVGEQDDHLMSVLRSPFTVELQGPELWLQQADGELGAGYSAD